MSKKTKIKLIIVLVIAGAIAFGVSEWKKNRDKFLDDDLDLIQRAKNACTEEAKICPDGTIVEREGENCEFAKCPTSEIPDKVNDLPKKKIVPGKLCVDQCGNGKCQEIVCMSQGCPCAETKESCAQDCK